MPWADPHSFYSLSFRCWWDASFSQFILLARHLWSQTTHPQHCRKNWVKMFLFVWTYFSFQIPKIYILLWFFDYHHMYYIVNLNVSTAISYIFPEMLPPPNSRPRSRPLAPKALRRRELCRSETLSACFVACSNWMAKGIQRARIQRAKIARIHFWGRFLYNSSGVVSKTQLCSSPLTTLSDTLCCKTNLIQLTTDSETSWDFHAISWDCQLNCQIDKLSETGILRPSVSFAPIPCSTARATWSASSCGAVANWRSGKGRPYNNRHYGVLILEFQDPMDW